MPFVRITLNRTVDKQRLADGIQRLLVTVLKIKPNDRLIVINENTEGFFQPPDTTGPYIVIELLMFTGRTLDTKRLLYISLTDLCVSYGFNRGNIRIILNELPLENWGIRGGKAACDVDLDYPINI